MSATLYVVTAYEFNHLQTGRPIDDYLFDDGLNSVFYFVDGTGAPTDFIGRSISERSIHPDITGPGKRWLAEWSFLISEYEKSFADDTRSRNVCEKKKRLPRGKAVYTVFGDGISYVFLQEKTEICWHQLRRNL